MPMEHEFRRFKISGTEEQRVALLKLLDEKQLTRDDLTLILHTMAFRDPCYDTLSQSLRVDPLGLADS